MAQRGSDSDKLNPTHVTSSRALHHFDQRTRAELIGGDDDDKLLDVVGPSHSPLLPLGHLSQFNSSSHAGEFHFPHFLEFLKKVSKWVKVHQKSVLQKISQSTPKFGDFFTFYAFSDTETFQHRSNIPNPTLQQSKYTISQVFNESLSKIVFSPLNSLVQPLCRCEWCSPNKRRCSPKAFTITQSTRWRIGTWWQRFQLLRKCWW